MLPYCAASGVGVIPWSPMARGRLTRPWDITTDRTHTDAFGSGLYGRDTTLESDRSIVQQVESIAAARGVPMATIALAWVLANPAVTSPIIGATKSHHIDDAVAALSITLTEDELTALSAPYVARVPAGF